jgi:acyl-coenzyme A synthetase/AMP-(fatty) acid ligase
MAKRTQFGNPYRASLIIAMARRGVPRDRIAAYLGMRLESLVTWASFHRVGLPWVSLDRRYQSRGRQENFRRHDNEHPSKPIVTFRDRLIL